nr:hypothetical protein [uncultured Oscillibacter sp.]
MALPEKSSVNSSVTHGVNVSFPDDEMYARLCYVADYFDWTLVKTVRSIVIRSLSGVHIGDDLCLSDWRDPRLDVKYKK